MTLSPWGPTPFLTRYGWSADDDAFTAGNPGLTKAHEAAAILGADLAVPDFGDDRPPRATDFNDLHRHAGAVAVKACLDKACLDKDGRSADGRARDYRFKIVAFSEVTLDMSAAYIVEDLVPQTGLAVFWGPPKCGKSFFVFDLMMHVALGWKFRDLKVRQGPVVYCALEGGRGFQNRIEAFRRKKLEDHTGHVPFYLMASPMALVADQLALVASIRGARPCRSRD